MKMKLRKITVALLCASIIVGLTSCGPTSERELIQEVVKNSDELVTISYSLWGGKTRTEYTEKAIERFETLNPGIHVNIKLNDYTGYGAMIDRTMADNSEADVMQIQYSWLNRYSSDGRGFYDLYELKNIIDLSQFTNIQINYGTKDGKLNALPNSLSTLVPVYDKKIFDKYDMAIPESIEDLEDSARLMKVDGVYPLVMDKEQTVSTLFTYNEQKSGNRCFNRSDKINIGKYEYDRMLIFYKRLIDYKVLCPAEDMSDDMLKDGRVAGIMTDVNGVDATEARINGYGGEAYLGKIITAEDAKLVGNYIKPDTMLAISNTTTHPKEAAMLVDFLLNSPENALLQQTEKGFPVSQKAEMTLMTEGMLNSTGYRAKLMMDYYSKDMDVISSRFDNGEYIDAFYDCLTRYANGDMSLDTASAELERLGNRY